MSCLMERFHYIGSSAFFAQKFLEAQAQLEGALCLYQELSAELKQAQVSCMLAYVYVAMQDYEKATEKAGAAIHVLRSVQRDDTQEAYSYTCMLLALIALSQQGCDEAVVYADSAVRHFREMENSRGEVSSLCALASAQFKVHDITGTFHCLEEALMLASQFDNKPLEIFCANLLGSLLVMRESLAQAAMVWGAASILSVECQQHNLYEQYALRLLPPDAYRAFMARAREQLGVEMYESWWKKGEHMTIEQAMEQEEQIVTKNLSVKQNLPGYMYQEQLTEREKEVLRLVSTGLTDAQVAQRLTVSPRTVSWHLSAIYRKINVSSRNAATVYAIEHHICQVSFSS